MRGDYPPMLSPVPGGAGPIRGASPGEGTSCDDGSGRSICGDCGGCVALQYACNGHEIS